MRTTKLLMAVAGTAMMLTVCDVKDPIYETAHPDHGKITLTTDWSDRADGVTLPASYTVKVGDHTATVSGTTNTIDNLFEPGSYRTHIYHMADYITVSGTTATVAAATRAGETLIHNAPGWFFSHAMDAKIEKDTHHEFTAVMRQQVRQLTLVIEPTGETADKVESIAATLSGVAGTLDIDNDTHGTPSSVALNFTKGSDGKWSATVRLLGVTGSEQKLSGTISFTGGSPGNISLDSDLTTALAAFNADKKTPLTLGGTTVETPTGAGFTATITGWTKITGGPVIAN